MYRVAVAGGAGYIGGEAVRLLLGHPELELTAVTSTRLAGRRLDGAHPNLRGLTDLCFIPSDDLSEYDALVVAAPHRETMRQMSRFLRHAKVVADLSGDFRLADPAVYERYYGTAHEEPDLLGAFVSGLPELHREELRTADRISVPGCMATAGILALYPPAREGMAEGDVVADMLTGSSGSGAAAGDVNLHAERSGTMRVFAPSRHRHEAEIAQATGLNVRMSAIGVEAVRGVQAIAHLRLPGGVDERELRAAYQRHYKHEPFVRVVAQRRGAYRLPEPKILSGTNFCDVGFAVEDSTATVVAALDNLVKGGAGNAVQSLNIRFGLPENLGLGFPGLHPN